MNCSCLACLLCCFSSHMVDDTHIQSGSPSSVKPLPGNFFPETRSCVLSGSKPHHDGKEVDHHPHWARALYWWWHLRVSVFNSVTEYYVKMNELLDETLSTKRLETGFHPVLAVIQFLGRPGVSCLIRDTVNTPHEQMYVAKCLSALQHSRVTFFKSWGIIYLIWEKYLV